MIQIRDDLIPIQGMDCSDCVLVIEHALGRMEGVVAASASYAGQTVRVEYDAGPGRPGCDRATNPFIGL